MNKKNVSPLDLSLLDDSALGGTIPDEILADLVKTQCEASKKPSTGALNIKKATQTAAAALQQPQAKSPLLSGASARPSPKVFSSRPTLRQLMEEYNRPRPASRLISSAEMARSESAQDFRSQRIEYIRIPNIPGKILRPVRTPPKSNA